MFFTTGCVFYRVGDWDDLQIDLHVSLHDGFKIQFAGIVPVFLEFNAHPSLNINRTQVSRLYCFHVKISLCIEYDLLLCISWVPNNNRYCISRKTLISIKILTPSKGCARKP